MRQNNKISASLVDTGIKKNKKIKKLRLITNKIVEQIDILEGVSIVQSMIKVSADFGSATDFGYFVVLTICIYILLIYLLYVQSR